MAIGVFGNAVMEALMDLINDTGFQEALERIKAMVEQEPEEQQSVHWTSRGEQFQEARKLPPSIEQKYSIIFKDDPRNRHHRRQHRG